jgi:hypothetical protein
MNRKLSAHNLRSNQLAQDLLRQGLRFRSPNASVSLFNSHETRRVYKVAAGQLCRPCRMRITNTCWPLTL